VAIPERLLYGVIGFVLVLVVWELAARLGLVKTVLLSSPSAIIGAAGLEFGSGDIWPQIGTSLAEWSVGFVIAIVVAIPFGFVVGLFRNVEYIVDPLLSAVYATPLVALVPIVIVIFGVDLPSKVFIVFLFAVVPLTIATINGVHATEKRYLDIARSFGATRGLTIRSVIAPSSIPLIVAGLRVAAGHALVGVIVAEFLAANAGLGFFISSNGEELQTANVMLGILLLGGFGIALGELIRRLEHRFDAWRPAIH
jgi:NitT/TauT family transport system permease protein